MIQSIHMILEPGIYLCLSFLQWSRYSRAFYITGAIRTPVYTSTYLFPTTHKTSCLDPEE